MTESATTIAYQRAGTIPPIFVAGSFCEWQPQELDHREVEGEYQFSKSFNIQPGTYQYKFRLGHGDWWICDDSAPTEIDGTGNLNNVLVINPTKPVDSRHQETRSPATEQSKHSSVGLDGEDDSVAEDGRSHIKLPASTENPMADADRPNGDVERKNNVTREPSENHHHQPEKGINGSVVNGITSVDRGHQKDSRDARKLSPNDAAQRSTVDEAGGRGTESPDAGDNNQKSVAVQGVVGAVSSLLCGKRSQLLAVGLTALIIPLVAWKLRT